MTRNFIDEAGTEWTAIVVDEVVAHGKIGTRLAFRPVSEPEAAPVPSQVTFNSLAAGEFALRTLGEKELRRRLQLALAKA